MGFYTLYRRIGASIPNQHHPGAARRMAKHLKLYRTLWKRSVKNMESVLGAGGHVAIEWPTSCSYWRFREVRAFIQKHDLKKVKIHGCALGAASASGIPIMKPWTICTSMPSLVDGLKSYRCSGDHDHEIIAGSKQSSRSAVYPPLLAKVVHGIFGRHCL